MQSKCRNPSKVAVYFVCRSCHFVDGDLERVKFPSHCNKCGKTSGRALLHFGSSVIGLINLLHDFHDTAHVDGGSTRSKCNHLGVVIIFVTLREVLLDKFIQDMLHETIITPSLKALLRRTHATHYSRLTELLPALCGKKWGQILSEIHKSGGPDYTSLDKFLVGIVKKRNSLLHQGDKWSPKPKDADDCISNLGALIRLHVDLHNHCVYPLHNVL